MTGRYTGTGSDMTHCDLIKGVKPLRHTACCKTFFTRPPPPGVTVINKPTSHRASSGLNHEVLGNEMSAAFLPFKTSLPTTSSTNGCSMAMCSLPGQVDNFRVQMSSDCISTWIFCEAAVELLSVKYHQDCDLSEDFVPPNVSPIRDG